jgi:single-stranded DNA-binding protein
MNQTAHTGNISTEIGIQLNKKTEIEFIRFQVACRSSYDTQFVDFIAWRKMARNIVKFAKKGDAIAITGEVVKTSFKNDSDILIHKQEIRVLKVTFVGEKDLLANVDIPSNTNMYDEDFHSEEE